MAYDRSDAVGQFEERRCLGKEEIMKNRLNVSKGVIAILLVLYQSRRENPKLMMERSQWDRRR